MQVSLNSSSISALSRLLGEQAVSTQQGTDASDSADKTAIQRALDAMTKAMEEDADDRKARAKQRLEEAKAQLEYLQRWSFDPAVVARQAAAIGQTVAGAANEFSSALAQSGSASSTPAASAESAALSVAQSPVQDEQSVDTDEEQTGFSFAGRAYQETMEERGNDVSRQDRQTLEEFKSVATELKAILDEALRRLQQQRGADKDAIENARTTANDLGTALSGVTTTLASVPTDTPIIDFTL